MNVFLLEANICNNKELERMKHLFFLNIIFTILKGENDEGKSLQLQLESRSS